MLRPDFAVSMQQKKINGANLIFILWGKSELLWFQSVRPNVFISSQIWSDTFFPKKVNPKTKYGYVMTVFAPFLNPNFHLPLFYRLLLPWTAWIASGFKYLLGWAEKQEACEVFFPLLWVNSKFTVYKIICQRKLYSNQNVQYHWYV